MIAFPPALRWAPSLPTLTAAQLRDGFARREAMSRHRGASFVRPAFLRAPMRSTSTGFDLRSIPVAMCSDSSTFAAKARFPRIGCLAGDEGGVFECEGRRSAGGGAHLAE